MSDLELNGVPLTEYVEGKVRTLGKYKGSENTIDTNANNKVESKISSGKNFDFKINGVDIYEYNYAEYQDFNNSTWISIPSWCNHLSFTIRGGGGGGGGASGSCYTDGYGQVGFTVAQSGGNGGSGGASSGTFAKGNAGWYIGIGNGGGGGSRGRNVAATGGNSQEVGWDNANGNAKRYGDEARGNNGGGGGVTYINSDNTRRLNANGGGGGNRGNPGLVRRSGYGDDAHILYNSYGGNNGGNGNGSYNETNYGNYVPGGGGGARGNAYRHQNVNMSATNGGINWTNTWNRSYPQNGDWSYQPNAGTAGGKGWGRVYFRRNA